MNDLRGRIDELEVKAAESALIADLITNWEIRTYPLGEGLTRGCRPAAAAGKWSGVSCSDFPPAGVSAPPASLLTRLLALLKATSSGSCVGLPCQPA